VGTPWPESLRIAENIRVRRHDVIVIGGGPGGLFAAARLAELGHDTLLVEEHAEFGRPVHCTGIVAREAFEEFGLGTGSILNALSHVRFNSPSGLQVDYDPTGVDAVVVDRAVFDEEIASRATAAGARLLGGRHVTRLSADNAGVTAVVNDGETLLARTAVLACGASYAFQRQLGLGMPTVYLASAQMELPAARAGDVQVFFGSQIAPAGFAWAVPVRRGDQDYVRVGLMCDGDAGYYFARLLERVRGPFGITVAEDVQPRRRLLPLGTIRRTYTDSVVAVGDAAGLVKPTTGGGIYYSLLSADLAVAALDPALRGDDVSAERLSGYEAAWRERLNAEFRSQLALRMLAQRLSDGEVDGLFNLARTDGIMPLVYKTAHFNRHRDLIAALFKHTEARKLLFRRLLS
jgi:geranylgeranyl reductase family protein